jgi:hypothetical protein
MDVKKIVIAFSVILMLSGAAVSVMKWLQIGPFEEITEEEKAAAEQAAVVPDEPPVAIEMEPINIPIFAEDRVAATVMIKLRIEVVGSENHEKVTKLLPRINDAFFKDLYSFIPRVIRRQNKLNASILVERMKMTGEQVMGPNVIHNVIIDEVNER